MNPGLVAAMAQAVFGRLGTARQDPGRATVTITIPGDHPKADKLRRLAAELADYRRLASGLEIRREYLPGSEERLKEVLREIVDDLAGAGAFDGIMADLGRRQAEAESKALLGRATAALSDPAGMGMLVAEAFKSKAFDGLEHHDAVRLLNKAEAQARTGVRILEQAGG